MEKQTPMEKLGFSLLREEVKKIQFLLGEALEEDNPEWKLNAAQERLARLQEKLDGEA